ncbi:uncharacterized protein J7T54_007441 [Emericellopsis cladophorae]|uniref:Transcription initiation factor TFIID subunit 4 n=1 Tax=Emericellopsis cladophorae TaxID=2686198 RepID=A0A9P9XWD4_9HYPO|nr:uncharacterized protein J7T54_007441 [Emericellopsis cladophorae]KAI6778788.1 hypothetical protein J7T54_007441 [Emericellopsis cladophorae]
MAQPTHAQPAFSPPPPQHSPSPTISQSGFAPPPKRVRTDGPQSQPDSPYPNSPFANSPQLGATPPPGGTGSPAPVQSPALQGQQSPYTNGASTPTLSLPEARPSPTPQVTTPQPLNPMASQYTTATMAPLTTPAPATQPGSMGPPQRPADRPAKDYEYDVTDSLAGTGIDLRAEEDFMANLYAKQYEQEAQQGFAQHPAGSKSTFFGAGPANQPAGPSGQTGQDIFAAQAAERAWAESARRLATQRTQEINDPFLLVALLHRRADKIAREHHLELIVDNKNNTQPMGKMKMPNEFPEPKVTVSMKPSGEDQAMVETTGSFIPHDAHLVDQLALMSIATKTRLRDLVEEAGNVAVHRQSTSHGEIPAAWEPASAPLNVETPEAMDVDGLNVDGSPAADSALKPDSNALENGAPAKKLPKISSYLTTTMRELAKQERQWEEARLRRRQQRKDGTADAAGSRSGSVAPGTPGSIAPEEKAPTKKEAKKALKAAEPHDANAQNSTSATFTAIRGKSLFGKKAKSYDWMTKPGMGGASTPAARTPGAKPSVGASPAAVALTTEGRNRLGTWREDKEKGKNIQLRDWVAALERDGRETAALQRAYIDLDLSTPR